jgi:hypothetical protein
MAAQPGISTTSAPPNTVVAIQPGMSVQPVVLVDQNGQYVTASTANALATMTAPVNVGNATAPTSGQVLTATSGTAATWQPVSAELPLTTLGDTLYENATPALARLPGNTSATKNFLAQTGTGAVSAAPAWGVIAAGDLPTGTTSAQGALQLDGTAGDIAALGAQAAGSIGKPADAGHVHPTTGVVLASSLPLAVGSGGTGQTAAAAAYNALSPMTTTGDIEYESAANTSARLAGPASATKQFLTSTGTGSAAQAPAWGAIAAADLPTGTTSAQGALQLDGTASDIKPLTAPGSAASAGSNGKVADSGHAHPSNLLAIVQYAPSTRSTYTSNSTTLAAMDATNLTASFTAPASGAVLIRLTGYVDAPTSAVHTVWGITDHTTTTTLYGVQMYVMGTTSPATYSAAQRITGLTPGTVYQMDWALASDTASSTVTVFVRGLTGTTAGTATQGSPALMEVWAA